MLLLRPVRCLRMVVNIFPSEPPYKTTTLTSSVISLHMSAATVSPVQHPSFLTLLLTLVAEGGGLAWRNVCCLDDDCWWSSLRCVASRLLFTSWVAFWSKWHARPRVAWRPGFFRRSHPLNRSRFVKVKLDVANTHSRAYITYLSVCLPACRSAFAVVWASGAVKIDFDIDLAAIACGLSSSCGPAPAHCHYLLGIVDSLRGASTRCGTVEAARVS